jgi:hypothetical protein
MICLNRDGSLNVDGENDMAAGTAFHLRSFCGQFLSVSVTGELCTSDELSGESCTFRVTACDDSVMFRHIQSDNDLGTLHKPSELPYTNCRAHGGGASDHDLWQKEANHWGALLLTTGEDRDGNMTLVAHFADSNTHMLRTKRNAQWITKQIGQAMQLEDRITFHSIQVPEQTSALCGLFTCLNLMTMGSCAKSGQTIDDNVGVNQQAVEDFRDASFDEMANLLKELTGHRWPTFVDTRGRVFRIPESSKRADVAHQATSTQTNQGMCLLMSSSLLNECST